MNVNATRKFLLPGLSHMKFDQWSVKQKLVGYGIGAFVLLLIISGLQLFFAAKIRNAERFRADIFHIWELIERKHGTVKAYLKYYDPVHVGEFSGLAK